MCQVLLLQTNTVGKFATQQGSNNPGFLDQLVRVDVMQALFEDGHIGVLSNLQRANNILHAHLPGRCHRVGVQRLIKG